MEVANIIPLTPKFKTTIKTIFKIIVIKEDKKLAKEY